MRKKGRREGEGGILCSCDSGYRNSQSDISCSPRESRTELDWTDLQQVDPVTRRVIGHARQRHEADWLLNCTSAQSSWCAVNEPLHISRAKTANLAAARDCCLPNNSQKFPFSPSSFRDATEDRLTTTILRRSIGNEGVLKIIINDTIHFMF